VRYDPTELVVTARAGTPLAVLESTLADKDQMLAFEPPHFARADQAATVGGCVAAGLSGPRRVAAGALRDFVLGVRVLDGRGRMLQFGGEVMKNVAGYDVARLLAGSLGTLGVILEVSLKVLPRPVEEQTLRLELAQAAAIEQLNAWGGQPLPISATAWSSPSTPRMRATTTTRSRSWNGATAARKSASTSRTCRIMSGRAARSTGRRWSGARASTWWTALSRCCRMRCRHRSARWFRARTA